MTHATVPGAGAAGAGRRTDALAREDERAKALRWAALAFGVVFTLVGIAGFIPGLTSDVDAMEMAGHESESELLGIFQVSVLHNVLHLLLGIAGILAWRRWTWARTYLLLGGLAYALLAAYGALVEHDADANFVPLNDADDWLHLGLAAVMIILGLALTPRRRDDRTAASARTGGRQDTWGGSGGSARRA
jgi:hypothetical protein